MSGIKVAVAGRGTMGAPLLERLRREGYDVAFSCTRREAWISDRDHRLFHADLTHEASIAPALDPYMDGVQVMFLAIPSGKHELPLIEYCLDRGVYVILFCKDALANEYARLVPRRHMIGANATVGGRTLSLPWLRMQYLENKQFVLYAYWNASTNFFMHGVASGGSARGMFDKAKDLKLAEPGSNDYVSFLNAEIGGDYCYKISIAMNDAMLGDGPYMTPDAFAPYVPLTQADVTYRSLLTRNDRYLIRIDNMGLPSEFDEKAGGSLRADWKGFAVRGGFCDLGRNTELAKWLKDGEFNGVQVRFEGDHSYEGTVQLAGLGAGPATVGAAMNDLYEFARARNGSLIEAKWPKAA